MFVEKFNLEGKVAIVTGASRGLGKHMSLHMARAGADIVAAARTVADIEQTAAEVKALGRRAIAIATDVTKPEQVEAMVQGALAEFGHIDILVNNAGGGGGGRMPIWEIPIEDWRYFVDLNLSSAFYCSRAVAQHMVERHQGKIINITSGWGFRGSRHGYMYGCAKGGVIQLTRVLAMSLAQDNIQVNCIAPGALPHVDRMSPEAREQSQARARFQAMGRFGLPWEVGPLCVFLASGASSYMTGETILIDGGALASAYAPTGFAPVA